MPFSSLACSELTTTSATSSGPHRAPLGFAGDPGGFPLYKNGTVVGGIGVLADGRYSIDPDINEPDANLDDEAIAVAGTFGFGAPVNRRADRLGLDGKTGRYTDVEYSGLKVNPATAAAFGTIGGAVGTLVNVTGYGGGTIIAGTAFGQPASGIRPGTEGNFGTLGAYVIVDGANANRYPATAGQALPGGIQLTSAEVQQLLESGIAVAQKTRSAIRFPYGAAATMSVVVVDHLGKILGIARTRDATIEGAGVALQKTRNAVLLSSADAASFLNALPPAQYLQTTTGAALSATASSPGTYVTNAQTFFAQPTLFADGLTAWSSRAVNNVSHPGYPDGIDGAPVGPLSKAPGAWSVFSPGLTLDISLNSILQHLLYIASSGAVPDVAPNTCAGTSFNVGTLTFANALTATQRTRLGDGLVLKPGGFPIYRNGVLIGAFGAAGDGTEQDDIVGFLGLYEGSQALAVAEGTNAPGHAPAAIRVDQLKSAENGVRPRYVVCPQSPLITGEQRGRMRGQVRMSLRLCTLSALSAAAILIGAAPAGAAEAQTCYQDNSGRILNRRTPGSREVPCPAAGTPRRTEPAPAPTPGAPAGAANNAAPPVSSAPEYISPIPRPRIEDYVASVPLPDRWRIVDTLGYKDRWYDPYNRNILKGDKPVHGDWFFNLGVISDTGMEIRQVATPSAGVTTDNPGTNGFFSKDSQLAWSENIAAEFVLYKGDTVFKPPEWEFRFIPAFNLNYVRLGEVGNVNVDPRDGRTRRDSFVGIQGAFVDKHLWNVSDNFDFDSIRVGIQPFSSDFRGFLFQDNQLGVRWFGTRANNRYQYNVAYFRRIEKDTNSGLNDIGAPLRKDDIVVANVYRQDTFVPGFTVEATVLYNRNQEDGEFYYDKNGLIQRPASLGREAPRAYDVVYAGVGGDGHFGRVNLTTSMYAVFGKEKPGVFVDAPVDVRAGFAAAEFSMDFDWLRPRVSLLYATGDKDPFDDVSTGFDAVFENPQFAGADTSYWIRQAVPLVGWWQGRPLRPQWLC